MKAAAQIERYDRRKHNAVMLTAALMQEIDDILDHEQRRAIHGRLLDVLYANGASIITDEERAKLGLEPRDELGWTPSERVAHEQRRIAAMQALSAIIVPADRA